MHDVIGWDIGGVNTKVARVSDGEIRSVRGRPYELQRDPAALAPMLQALAVEVGADDRAVHALTMTAELSQMFRTKRDGVAFVLDAVAAAFPAAVVRVFAVDGRLLLPEDARREPLAVAAANWSATAHAVARQHPAAVLIDIGTTTTDIIPIVGGAVVAEGWTDPARLASGELVYTGALRTPAEAIVQQVPLGGAMVGVSAECFALAGDVARVARRSRAGRLHRDDARWPPRHPRVRRRATRTGGVRGSRDDRRGGGIGDCRRARGCAGVAHRRQLEACARPSSVAPGRCRHRTRRVSGRRRGTAGWG